jgi:hypothetical protein
MDGEGCTISSVGAAGRANALGDIENDACEAIFVKIYLLTVRNLTYCANSD